MNLKDKHIKYLAIGIVLFLLIPVIGTIIGLVFFYKSYKAWPKSTSKSQKYKLILLIIGSLIFTYLTFGWIVKGCIVHESIYFIIGGIFAFFDFLIIWKLIKMINGEDTVSNVYNCNNV